MPGRVGEGVTYSVEEVAVPDGYRVVYTPLEATQHENGTELPFVITNTYEETKITATKTWDDANNQDGLRKPVKFKLQRKLPGETTWSNVPASALTSPDTLTKDIGITSSNTTAEWSHLLAWANNQRVEYRVVEIPDSNDAGATLENYLTGYTTTYGSFAYPSAITPAQTTGGTPTYKIEGTNATITNTHTPQTYTQSNPLTFTKTWDHKGVVYEYPSDLTTSQYINKLHLWARVEEEGTNDSPVEAPVEVKDTNWDTNWGLKLFEVNTGTAQEPVWERNNDWKSHATVGEGYVVTITDLPLYKPKSSETDTTQALEYFISEDEGNITHYTMTTAPDVTVGNNKLVKLCSSVTPLSNVQMKNERDTGSLKIAKSVVSDLAADHDKQFSFTITTNPTVTGLGASYTYTVANVAGTPVSSGTVTFQNGESSVIRLQSGQTATIEGLPVGVVYTVTETQETDFEVPQYKIDNTGEFVDVTSSACVCNLNTKDQRVKAEFNNIRKKNDLVISKTVHSVVQVDKTRDYVFQVTLSDTSISKTYSTVKTAANNTTTNGSITFKNGVAQNILLKHGETLRIVDLPVTVGYTVHEVFQTDDSTKLVSVADQSGSISSSEASTASFTNQRQTGSLKLTKELRNHIPTDDGDTFYFDVELVGDDGEALDLSDTVAQISVKVNGTVKSFDAQPAAGDTVSGYPMYYDASTKTLKNVPVVWLTSLLQNEVGGTTEILGLPVGTTYSATEKDLTTITTKGNLIMNSGAVPTPPAQIATGEQTADFVNERRTGSLSVTKHVVSPIPAEKDSNATYNLTVTLNTAHGSKGNAGSVSATLKRSTIANDTGTPITFTDGAYTITGIHHDETVTIEGIPTDLTYLVAETDLNRTKFNNTIEVKTDTGQGQDVYQDITDPNVSRNILADQTPAEVRVTNTRKTGRLEVSKTVYSSVSTDSSRKFDYTVVVTDPDDSSAVLDTTVANDYYGTGLTVVNGKTFTFTLTGGQTQTIKNLPDGWVYKVTESTNTSTDGISLDKFDTAYTKSGTVSANGTGTEFNDTSNAANKIDSTVSTVDFTNTRKTGSLTITKALSNAIPTDDGDTFYFDVEVKGDDGQALTLDSTNAPIMVGDTLLTNTSGTGRALHYDASACKIKNVPVQFSKNGTNAITITGLPQGATYRVSETGLSMAINGMDSGHITQQSETVPATSAGAGTIDADGETAGFSNARQTGGLSITKAVDSPVRAEEAADRKYEVTISLQTKHTVGGEQKPVDVTATLGSNDSQAPSNAENTVTFTNGVATVCVHNGETVTLTGIPVDVEYTISEENESLFGKAYTAGGQTGPTAEIPVGTTSAATITNTRKTGGLAVDKTVHSTVPSDKSKKFTFTVHVKDPDNPDLKIKATNGYGTRVDGQGAITFDDNNDATFTLANNDEAQTIANLPTNWTYTVTETAVENFTTTKSADTGTIGAAQSNAAFINTRDTGTLTLTKTLTNAIPTDDGDTFYFDVELRHGTNNEKLVLDTNAPIKVGSVALTATSGSGREPYYDATNGIIRNVPVVWHKANGTTSAGGTTVISGLPIDTTCIATELTTTKEVGGQSVVIPVMTPASFETSIDPPATTSATNTITADASNQEADFTNTRHVGSLQISKTVSSHLAADYNENFAFAVQSNPALTGDYNVTYGDDTTGTLTFDSTGKATGQLSLKSGQHVTIAGLPVDVDYTVTENLSQAQQADFDAASNPTDGKQQTHKNSIDTVSFTNTRKHGSLNVSKTMVSPDDADKTKLFEFTVTLDGLKEELNTVTYDDVTFTRDASTGKYVGTFSQHAGQTKTFSGLPTDATYTVTETPVTNYTTAKTGDTGTIGDTASTAAFTNTRKVGNLKIQKSLTNAIPDDAGDVFYFDVALTDGQDSAHPLHLDLSNDAPAVKVGNTRLTSTTAPTQTDDKSLWYEYDSTNNKAIIHNVPLTWNSDTGATNEVLITGLPQAATCTVEETDFTVPSSMNKANITKDGTASAQKTIDATVAQEVAFTNVRKTGNLQIKKAVESPVDMELAGTYTLGVSLKTKSNTPVQLSGLQITRQQQSQEPTTGTIDFDANGTASIANVHNNETIAIDGIPTDVKYTIFEDGATDFAKKFEVKTGTNGQTSEDVYKDIGSGVEVLANTTSEARVTNTREVGQLKVAKSVQSAVASDSTHSFTFVVQVAPPTDQAGSKLVDGTYGGVAFTNNVSKPIALAHSGQATITGLPTGWTYTVAETGTDAEAAYLNNFDTTWARKVGDGNPTEPIVADNRVYAGPQGNANAIASGLSAVTCINTRKTGNLKLLKEVASPFAAEQDAYYPLTVTLRMPASGGSQAENISGTFAATGLQSGTTVTFTNGVATVNVKKGTPVTISGLPIGVEYVVEETSPNSTLTPEVAYKLVNGETLSNDTRSQHTIAAQDATYGAQVTNTRNTMLVSICKISALNYDTKLVGAVFTLKPMEQDNAAALGWTSKELVSDTDGYLYQMDTGVKVKQFELRPGHYQLTENKAPLGYHKLAQPATFEVTANYSVLYTDSILGNNPIVVDTQTGATSSNPANRYVLVNVANSTGAELPSTGGSGLTLVYVVGCVYAALAGAVVLLLKRNRGVTSA